MIQPQPSAELLEIEIERVLASPRFANSPRLSRFLRFIVQHTLAGRTAMLKESVIAMEVYERGPDYDSSKVFTVRAEASRLRRALAEYYDGLDAPSPIRIEVPKGSYVPTFAIQAPASQTAASPRRSQRVWLFVLGASLILIAALGVRLWPGRLSTPRPEAVRLLVQASDALSVRRTVPKPGVTAEVRDALRLFQAATEADPSYAAAWAGLARGRYEAARSDRPRLLAWVEQSRRAALEATRLDPNQAVGLTVQARIAYSIDFNLLAAEKLYRLGVPLDPRDDEASEEYVDLLGQLGKANEAKGLVASHLSLAPQHQHWRIQEAKLLVQQGRIEEAEQQIASAILADPRQIAFTTILNGRDRGGIPRPGPSTLRRSSKSFLGVEGPCIKLGCARRRRETFRKSSGSSSGCTNVWISVIPPSLRWRISTKRWGITPKACTGSLRQYATAIRRSFLSLHATSMQTTGSSAPSGMANSRPSFANSLNGLSY